MDPYQPLNVPSSPSTLESSQDGVEDLLEAADSVPLFGYAAYGLADPYADTVPAGNCVDQSRWPVPFRWQLVDQSCIPVIAEAPSVQQVDQTGAEPSVQSINWTGRAAEDNSESQGWCDTEYSELRADQNVVLDHVLGKLWPSVVVDTLNLQQRTNLLFKEEIRYGDDCSGARGPYEALCQLVTKLCHVGLTKTICIRDVFASEHPGKAGDGPRKFINAQCRPDIIFNTVHRGTNRKTSTGATAGLDLLSGKLAPIPANLTIYTAGWVCRDVSTMNCHRKLLLPGDDKKVVAGKAGASSQTLNSSLQYIKANGPDIAVLENLVNNRNISIAVNALKGMGGYSTCVLLIDSRTFHVPMSRRRMYLVAIRTDLLTASLGELATQLSDVAIQIGSQQQLTAATLETCLDVSDTLTNLSAMDTGERKRINRKRIKWIAQHDAIRNALGLPTREKIVDKVKAHSPMAALLPLRCQELLGMHWEIAIRGGIYPGDHHFIWDLTNSAKFACAKDPRLAGIVPCALRGHCLWDTKLGRPLSGTELLRVHGFCLLPAVAELDDNIIRQLAGDTISVPPMACILTLALANTAPHASIPGATLIPDAYQQKEHHISARWIGPSAWRGFDRARDNLMSLAGLQPRRSAKKARSSRAKRAHGRQWPKHLVKRHLGSHISID